MKKVLTYSLLLCALLAFSQEKKKGAAVKEPVDRNLPQGNKDFENKDYVDAEAQYRISNSKAPTKAIASYNLGNAIYKQKKPGEAIYAYAKAVENAKDKKQKHMAYHNMGNVLMEQKNYQGAVEAYKNALRNDPTDNETRYNFALAKDMLKNNPPPKDDKKDPPKGKDDDKSQKPEDNKKDKNKGDDKDKGDKGKDKEQDNKDKGDQKDKNKDKGDQKDKDNGDGKDQDKKADANPSDASPSKEQMKNMLDAMNNEEKKVQDKLNAKRVKGQPKRQEKDW